LNALAPIPIITFGDPVEPIIDKSSSEILAESLDNSKMKDLRHLHGPVCRACFQEKLACQSRRNGETRDHRTKTVQTNNNKSPENPTMKGPLNPPDLIFRACSEKGLPLSNPTLGPITIHIPTVVLRNPFQLKPIYLT
jgi:hypothetical protein